MNELTKIEVQNSLYNALSEIKGISANLSALSLLAEASAKPDNEGVSFETLSESLHGMSITLNRIINDLYEIC